MLSPKEKNVSYYINHCCTTIFTKHWIALPPSPQTSLCTFSHSSPSCNGTDQNEWINTAWHLKIAARFDTCAKRLICALLKMCFNSWITPLSQPRESVQRLRGRGVIIPSLLLSAVHVCSDPRRHPGDRRGLPLPAAAARGRVPPRQRRGLPGQPRRALEPGHRHREGPQDGSVGVAQVWFSRLLLCCGSMCLHVVVVYCRCGVVVLTLWCRVVLKGSVCVVGWF